MKRHCGGQNVQNSLSSKNKLKSKENELYRNHTHNNWYGARFCVLTFFFNLFNKMAFHV